MPNPLKRNFAVREACLGVFLKIRKYSGNGRYAAACSEMQMDHFHVSPLINSFSSRRFSRTKMVSDGNDVERGTRSREDERRRCTQGNKEKRKTHEKRKKKTRKIKESNAWRRSSALANNVVLSNGKFPRLAATDIHRRTPPFVPSGKRTAPRDRPFARRD